MNGLKADRAALFAAYKRDNPEANDPEVERYFTAYDRYHEADLVIGKLKELGLLTEGLTVLDYGCGAGDYGIELMRADPTCRVTFLDFPEKLSLVHYRARLGGLGGRLVAACPSGDKVTLAPTFDLVIFGEVLEHLTDPLAVLVSCRGMLVTSSYPYRDDPSYFDHEGHTKDAKDQQYACRAYLEERYNRIVLEPMLCLWIPKER